MSPRCSSVDPGLVVVLGGMAAMVAVIAIIALGIAWEQWIGRNR